MSIKKFLLGLVLSRKQRNVIWKALIYSEYKYRKNGNVEKAARVHQIMDEVAVNIGAVKKSYTKDEVDSIVNGVISDLTKGSGNAIDEAYKKGLKDCGEKAAKTIKQAYEDGAKAAIKRFKESIEKAHENAIFLGEIKIDENDTKDEILDKIVDAIAKSKQKRKEEQENQGDAQDDVQDDTANAGQDDDAGDENGDTEEKPQD